jgi:hypothetical protein
MITLNTPRIRCLRETQKFNAACTDGCRGRIPAASAVSKVIHEHLSSGPNDKCWPIGNACIKIMDHAAIQPIHTKSCSAAA